MRKSLEPLRVAAATVGPWQKLTLFEGIFPDHSRSRLTGHRVSGLAIIAYAAVFQTLQG